MLAGRLRDPGINLLPEGLGGRAVGLGFRV